MATVKTDSPLGPTEVSPAPLSVAHRSSLLKREMPGLDALRGVAVLAVVGLHGLKMSQPANQSVTPGVTRVVSIVTGGWLGVTLFFVLSGFLITGILLDTRTRENYWSGFYVRRVLRILPMFLLSLVVVRLTYGVGWVYIGLCLLFIANMIENRMASFGPFWSLAVEEQFYLFWPILVRRLRPRTLGVIALASILCSPILRILSGYYPLGNPYSSMWLITDCLLLGAFIAIFLRSRYSTPANVKALSATLACLSLIFGIVCAHYHLFSRGTVLGNAFSIEPFLFFFGFLLLLSLYFGDHPIVFRLTSPLRFYGYISYGLYLLHFPFFFNVNRFLDHGHPARPVLTAPALLLRFTVSLAIITAICYLSRRYFEEFFLRLKDRLVPYKSKPSRQVA